MQRRIATIVPFLAIIFAAGCDVANVTRNPKSKSTFPAPGPSALQITVLQGTTFVISRHKCQLLGVAEVDDPILRQRAVTFTQKWFESVGNCIAICNYKDPIWREDGTCLVWMRGYDHYYSCLNTELVRAGLAHVDYRAQADYSFKGVVFPDGYVQTNWKAELDLAKQGHDDGERPRVTFPWPE